MRNQLGEVNGRVFPVRDQGGWQFARGAQAQEWIMDLRWTHTFEVPLDALIESDGNEVAVGCAGEGGEFLRFGGMADWILPEEACLCPRVGDQSPGLEGRGVKAPESNGLRPMR